MDIHYTRGNISKALLQLVIGDEPMPRRAWEAYMIIIRGSARDGFESQFYTLDQIFGDIPHEQVDARISSQDARRGAGIILDMYESLKEDSTAEPREAH
jgi:hypothetical protein